MKHFRIFDFSVDSHINKTLAATAARSLDRVFGGQIDLEARFELSPGSTPGFCHWDLGGRWGHCDEDGRVTEWDGECHVTL